MVTVGFVELNSIAKGIEVADAILKAADTELVIARPCCPGKYSILFTGEVAAVKASLDTALALGDTHIIDKTVIPRVHPQVIDAINQTVEPEFMDSLGIMEYFSITAAVYGADAATKAADVRMIDLRLGTGIGGKSYAIITGEVAAVAEAVQCGTREAEEQGLLVEKVVIPSPRPEIFRTLL